MSNRSSALTADRWPGGPGPSELQHLADGLAGQGFCPRIVIDQQWLLFRGVDLQGKAVLDVGAGAGHASAYAVACGATSVVALEPELSGSTSGAGDSAASLHRALGYDSRITILTKQLQMLRGESLFDIVVLNASINHLHEAACARLHDSAEARALYRPLLLHLAELCKPGGLLIVSDCSNRNFFGDLGLRNPLMTSIRWPIHQSPKTWARLLRQAGFDHPRIDWIPVTRKASLGRILSIPWVAYFINSLFRLVMQKR